MAAKSANLSPNQRVQAAGVRACDAYTSVTRTAKKLEAELDEITNTGINGVPIAPLDPEDSMVVAVVAVIAAHQK